MGRALGEKQGGGREREGKEETKGFGGRRRWEAWAWRGEGRNWLAGCAMRCGKKRRKGKGFIPTHLAPHGLECGFVVSCCFVVLGFWGLHLLVFVLFFFFVLSQAPFRQDGVCANTLLAVTPVLVPCVSREIE